MRYSLTVLHSLTCLTLLNWILPFLLTQGAAADQPIEPDLPPLTSEQDLTQLSLEELMNMEVTSVSKKPQKLSQAQAAIHVLSGEDIRRMGITTIPDALRLVPGLQVARIDSNKWAVSARGFNDRFANKLLVLIDGRSVYTPLFAGVYWEAQMVPLQDIDRIEVIRGPGGTLWGANAVNGVINIITKSTQDTQGAMASVTYGNEERGLGTLRYGGKAGDALAYRLYGQFMSRDSAFQEGGAHDDWQLGQGGLRTDWQPDTNDTVTVQGDYYQGTAGQRITTPVPADATPLAPANLTTVNEDVKLRGGNILFRWHRLLSDKEDFTLQAYFDHVGREEASLYEDRQTIDLELQHHIPWLAHHDVLWGIGYRLTRDETRGNELFRLSPSDRTVDLMSGFLQDEMSFFDDTFTVTIGSKFEHNDFSGFEYQPNIRMSWKPNSDHTIWGSVSRAVRTPARGEHDVRLRVVPTPATAPVSVAVVGNHDFEAENLLAWELGYRIHPTSTLNLDIAGFYNQYEDLRTFDAASPPPTITLPFSNKMHGHAYGVEVLAQWQAHPDWRLQATYSYLAMDLRLEDGSTSAEKLREGASPSHQATLWSRMTLPWNLEFDWDVRYVDSIRVAGSPVDGYFSTNARLGWRPTPQWDISLVGRDLLDNHHTEFLPTFLATQSTEVQRSIFLKTTWQFDMP